ncbi:hypothetical protein ACWD4J_41745 [Streptomyces sp. NPDC002577]
MIVSTVRRPVVIVPVTQEAVDAVGASVTNDVAAMPTTGSTVSEGYVFMAFGAAMPAVRAGPGPSEKSSRTVCRIRVARPT